MPLIILKVFCLLRCSAIVNCSHCTDLVLDQCYIFIFIVQAFFIIIRKSTMKRISGLIGRTALSCWHHGSPRLPPAWVPGPPSSTCLQVRHLAAKQVRLKMLNASLMLIRRVTAVPCRSQD